MRTPTNLQLDNIADNPKATEALKLLLEAGIIDASGVEDAMQKAKQKKMLDAHPYSIYKGKDGRWCTYVKEPGSNKRKKIVKSTEEQLNNALCDWYDKIDPISKRKKITLADIYPEWLEFKALHVSEGTVERVENDWNKYYAQTDVVNIPLCKLDKITLDTWAHNLVLEYDMSKKQFYNAALIMKQALEYAVDKDILDYSPYAKVKVQGRMFRQVWKRNDISEVFSKEEQTKLERLAMDEFIAQSRVYVFAPLAVLFQFQTVLRVGELCALRYEDIQGKELIVRRFWSKNRRKIVNHTKGAYGVRIIPLTDRALEILEMIASFRKEHGIPLEGYIFSISGKPLSYDAVDGCYAKYCKELGIQKKSSHKTRKTGISAMVDAGINLSTIGDIAGHMDERTTLQSYVYDRSSEEERRQKLNKALS